MTAYLVIIRWPDGTEGLLFPRPGNVPIAATLEQGKKDFETAKRDIQEYWDKAPHHRARINGAQLRLIPFEQHPSAVEYFEFKK